MFEFITNIYWAIYDPVRVLILNLLGSYIPAGIVTSFYGSPTLTELGVQVRHLRAKYNPPNFNKVIDAPGLNSGDMDIQWLAEIEDRKRSDPVLLFFHGGAYTMPITPTQIEMLMTIWASGGKECRLSIVWFVYTLSGHEPYPKQLIEGAAAYAAVAKLSDKIILIGDSAGGHLAVSVMRHLQAPFPYVPPIEPNVKPYGAILVSPWLEVRPKLALGTDISSSYWKYKWTDIISLEAIRSAGMLLLPTDELISEFASMHENTSIDWASVLPPANRVLITVGEKEVLRDSTEKFAQLIKLEELGGTVYVEKGAIHDTPYVYGNRRTSVTPKINNFLQRIL